MIVLDTGPLVAIVDADDADHERTRAWFQWARNEPTIVPAPVLGEAWYLIGKKCGPAVEAELLNDLGRGAYGTIVVPTPEGLFRTAELVTKYADMPLGGTDACVIAVAERLRTARVATLDHRHFTAVRPRHTLTLTLLPN